MGLYGICGFAARRGAAAAGRCDGSDCLMGCGVILWAVFSGISGISCISGISGGVGVSIVVGSIVRGVLMVAVRAVARSPFLHPISFHLSSSINLFAHCSQRRFYSYNIASNHSIQFNSIQFNSIQFNPSNHSEFQFAISLLRSIHPIPHVHSIVIHSHSHSSSITVVIDQRTH